MNNRYIKIIVKIIIALVLIIELFFIRSIYTPPIEEGADPMRKWVFADNIVKTNNFNFLAHNQHSARWGINIPLVATLKILGNKIKYYYHLPLFYFSIFFILFAYQAKKKFNYVILFSFILVSYFEPMFFRASSQIQPFVFGAFYLLCSFIFIEIYLTKGKKRYIIISSIFYFMTYACKETYIMFLPGIILFLILKTNYKKLILFISSFFLLFTAETLLFNKSSEDINFGRPEVILNSSHFTAINERHIDRENKKGFEFFIELHRRAFNDATAYHKFVLPSVLIFFLYIFVSRKIKIIDNFSLAVFLSMLSYLIFCMFPIYNLNPIKYLQWPLIKYHTITLPFLTYLLFYSIYFIYKEYINLNFLKYLVSTLIISISIIWAASYIFFNGIIKYRHGLIFYPNDTNNFLKITNSYIDLYDHNIAKGKTLFSFNYIDSLFLKKVLKNEKINVNIKKIGHFYYISNDFNKINTCYNFFTDRIRKKHPICPFKKFKIE